MVVDSSMPHSNGLWKVFHKTSHGNTRILGKLIPRSTRVDELNNTPVSQGDGEDTDYRREKLVKSRKTTNMQDIHNTFRDYHQARPLEAMLHLATTAPPLLSRPR